jgi:hypothetical protein
MKAIASANDDRDGISAVDSSSTLISLEPPRLQATPNPKIHADETRVEGREEEEEMILGARWDEPARNA